MPMELKYVFEFERMRRRGLENVRAEMTEKVIAYNPLYYMFHNKLKFNQ